MEIPGNGSEQPNSGRSESVAPPIALSPTPTATPTPTPAPTPVSPWADFTITQATLGQEILDRLSDEETACLDSTTSDAYREYFETLPLRVLISTNPPVRDVSDLPALADCLTAASTSHLNRAIAHVHDPTLVPTPEPAPTPRPTPVATATPTPRPTATPNLTRGSAGWIQALELRIHELVNRQRATPLGFDSKLASIARSHSADMATSRFFSHTNLSGQSPTDRGAAVGYDCRKNYGTYYTYGLAENIYQAWLYGSYRTLSGVVVSKDYHSLEELANLVVGGWMDSPSHRENILNSSYEVEGIGVAVNDDEEVYVTQNFC